MHRFSVRFFISRKNNDIYCVSLSYSSGYLSRGKEETELPKACCFNKACPSKFCKKKKRRHRKSIHRLIPVCGRIDHSMAVSFPQWPRNGTGKCWWWDMTRKATFPWHMPNALIHTNVWASLTSNASVLGTPIRWNHVGRAHKSVSLSIPYVSRISATWCSPSFSSSAHQPVFVFFNHPKVKNWFWSGWKAV